MRNNGRTQCLVVRENRILTVKHRQEGIEYFCLHGGGIEDGETPEDAAVRELKEECLVERKGENSINQLLGNVQKDYIDVCKELIEHTVSLGYLPHVTKI